MSRSRVLLVLPTLGLCLALAGCGSDAPTADKPSPRPSVSTSPSPSAAQSPSAATTPAVDPDSLEAAGVSKSLAKRVIAEADADGYGPADEGFVSVMVTVCRDVRSGYKTWDELTDEDVASGAPRADATTFYRFVRTTLCPSVKAKKAAAHPSGSGKDTSAIRPIGTRIGDLDKAYPTGSLARCRTLTGEPLGTPRAYTVRPGVLLCTAYSESSIFKDTVAFTDVVFNPPVKESVAKDVAALLLPEDAAFESRRLGSNPSYASRTGSCASLLYSSSDLRDALKSAGIKDADREATAVMYGDRQTDYGSRSSYSGTVQVMSLGVGGHNFGYKSNKVTC